MEKWKLRKCHRPMQQHEQTATSEVHAKGPAWGLVEENPGGSSAPASGPPSFKMAFLERLLERVEVDYRGVMDNELILNIIKELIIITLSRF